MPYIPNYIFISKDGGIVIEYLKDTLHITTIVEVDE